MNNHWLKKEEEELRPLLTLLVDKITNFGHMIGAHRGRNWLTNPTYENSDIARMQGTLDRIGKVTYRQSFHVDEKKHCAFSNPCYLGPDLYDHTIRCDWKELFGPGKKEISDVLKDCYKQDEAGRWHPPMDEGMWISLWHPNKQQFQEKVSDCWLQGKMPTWQPVYSYTKEEVIDALQIMCKTFGWEFEEGGKMTTVIMH